MKEIKFKHNWSYIAVELFSRSRLTYFRTRDKCREHWQNHLDPRLKKSNWTIEEDIMLLNLVISFGKKWAKIVN